MNRDIRNKLGIKELYELGELPPLGHVPEKMYAWTIRGDRLGEPKQAMKLEVVPVPRVSKNQILVLNMASGINYNGIWASLGKPKNVMGAHGKYEEKQDFIICGSESSGIVYAVGEEVEDFKVGDEVICGASQFDKNCERYKETGDPRLSRSFRVWGYEANWGAFAQFSRVLDIQCVKKPKNVSWEVGASMATGATVYDMLTRYKENAIKKGDSVLVWGGSGGVGAQAIKITRALGGIPVAVVSSDDRGELCIKEGAAGYINRSNYNHWGEMTEEIFNDPQRYQKWLTSATKFKMAIAKITGKKDGVDIVVEHPGKETMPTSLFVCREGGMVVTCGATSGYLGSFDLRYLWLKIRRIQGSHAYTTQDVINLLNTLDEEQLNSDSLKVYDFTEVAQLHQDIFENKRAVGNMVVKIAYSEEGSIHGKMDKVS